MTVTGPEMVTRRAAIARLVGALSPIPLGWAGGVRAAVEDAGAGRELLADPEFARGFRLCEPEPGRRVPYGVLRGFSAESPVWDLDQWSSRHRLSADPARPSGQGLDLGGERRWQNAGKRVVLVRGQSGYVLELAVFGKAEYGDRARREGEPWAHLLAEQALVGGPSVDRLSFARFRVEARLESSRLHRTEDYSPGRHAAQFQVFLAVQNTNPRSEGQGRLVWFGIPLYDDRHRIPPEHKTRDTGGTGMFIFTPRGDVYTQRSAHDGEWVAVDLDLAPLIRESLAAAWARGFLTESRDPADYRITSINLGWEVPGILDVAMRVRGLSLRVP